MGLLVKNTAYPFQQVLVTWGLALRCVMGYKPTPRVESNSNSSFVGLARTDQPKNFFEINIVFGCNEHTINELNLWKFWKKFVMFYAVYKLLITTFDLSNWVPSTVIWVNETTRFSLRYWDLTRGVITKKLSFWNIEPKSKVNRAGQRVGNALWKLRFQRVL